MLHQPRRPTVAVQASANPIRPGERWLSRCAPLHGPRPRREPRRRVERAPPDRRRPLVLGAAAGWGLRADSVARQRGCESRFTRTRRKAAGFGARTHRDRYAASPTGGSCRERNRRPVSRQHRAERPSTIRAVHITERPRCRRATWFPSRRARPPNAGRHRRTPRGCTRDGRARVPVVARRPGDRPHRDCTPAKAAPAAKHAQYRRGFL